MKTKIILMSAILVSANIALATGYGTSSKRTSSAPTQDLSGSVSDQTINPARIEADRKNSNRQNQWRVSRDVNQSNMDSTIIDTDSTGHKSDQAPATRE